MEQREPLVDLLLGIGPLLDEDLVAKVAVHDLAPPLLGRDRDQSSIADEGPQHLRLEGRVLPLVVHGGHRTMPRMLPDGRRLGAHVPLGAGMVKAVDRAAEIGATAIQIFTDNPTAWARRAEPPTELPVFRDRLATAGIDPVVAHASYLVNLAGQEPHFYDQSIELLAQELLSGPGFGVRFVNVHIGSHRGAGVDVGIEHLGRGVAATLARADAMAGGPAELPVLLLENSAGAGWGLGTDVAELAAIAAAIEDAGVDPARVGFCLDVAHAWGAGIDVADPAATDAF